MVEYHGNFTGVPARYVQAATILAQIISRPAPKQARIDAAWKIVALINPAPVGRGSITVDPIGKKRDLAYALRLGATLLANMRRARRILVAAAEPPELIETWAEAKARAARLDDGCERRS